MTPNPPRLQLSAEHVALAGAYLMDVGDFFYLDVGKVAPQFFCEKVMIIGKPVSRDTCNLETALVSLTFLPDNWQWDRLISCILDLRLAFKKSFCI